MNKRNNNVKHLLTVCMILNTFLISSCSNIKSAENNPISQNSTSDEISKAFEKFKIDSQIQRVNPNEIIKLVQIPKPKSLILTNKNYLKGQVAFVVIDIRDNNNLIPVVNIYKLMGINAIEQDSYGLAKEAGKDEKVYPSLQAVFDPQFSPNGKYLAFKFGDYGLSGRYKLYVYDFETKKTTLVFQDLLDYYAVSWSPDSKHLAFAKGGGVDPRVYYYGRTYYGKITLCIANWKTGKIDEVMSNSSLRGDWTWRGSNTLVFGALDDKESLFLNDSRYEAGVDFKNGQPIGWERLKGNEKRQPVTPKIYEYSLNTKKVFPLYENGYHPYFSPDGKLIASFGSADDKNPMYLFKGWQNSPAGQYLMIRSLDDPKSQPRLLGQFYKSYPFVLWLPDNMHLLTFEDIVREEFGRELQIKKWDIQTGHQKLITNLKLKQATSEPAFTNPVLSKDGGSVVVVANEDYQLDKNGYSTKSIVKEINLKTGQVRDIAIADLSLGASWTYHVESTR